MRRCLTLVAAQAQPARRTTARLCTAGPATGDVVSTPKASDARFLRDRNARAEAWQPRIEAWRRDAQAAKQEIKLPVALKCARDLLGSSETYAAGLTMFQLLFAENLLTTKTYCELLEAALAKGNQKDRRFLGGLLLIKRLAKLKPPPRDEKKWFFFVRALTRSSLVLTSQCERHRNVADMRSYLDLSDQDVQYVSLATAIANGAYDVFVTAYEKLDATTPQLVSLLVRACLMQAIADPENAAAYKSIAEESIEELADYKYMFGPDFSRLERLTKVQETKKTQD